MQPPARRLDLRIVGSPVATRSASMPCNAALMLRHRSFGAPELDGITRFATGEASAKLERVRFRRFSSSRPNPGVMQRQSTIALLAFQAFESREDACAFLNTDNAALGGRPVEIAGESDLGLEKVRAALAGPA